jgi:CIC family chloride channel protein
VAAWALLEMIALCTNLFYFHHWSFKDHDPWQAGRHWWLVLMPVLGGLIVGCDCAVSFAQGARARHAGGGGDHRLRRGKVQPRVAVLKPIATAISIGSGGPFGAEGPVIITGGAIGSRAGPVAADDRLRAHGADGRGRFGGHGGDVQLPHVRDAAGGGDSALRVEAAVAGSGGDRLCDGGRGAAAAAGAAEPAADVPTGEPVYHSAMLGALLLGVIAAFVAAGLSKAVHWCEQLFEKIPIHWMWWPAIGGLGVGLGGLIFPRRWAWATASFSR